VTLNKSSRIGLFAVVMMAENPEARISAAQVAQRFRVSEDHVAKVLQQLMRARIVTGIRGVGGGYRLVADSRKLTMLDVVEVLEGPKRQACFGCDLAAEGTDSPGCPEPAACAIRGVLDEIGQHAWATLHSVTIATLAARRERLPASPRLRIVGRDS
jgi:Rrf2 family transcriptional regulator, nitric oxide-sensitive transcriptional repressor